MISVPHTCLNELSYFSVNTSTIAYINTVLRYTFHTLGNLKYLYPNVVITNKDNNIIAVFDKVLFMIKIPINILNNIQKICVLIV
jgi:hypothetical protein